MNQQAESLNEIIKTENMNIFSLLSKKGREIYYPGKGILAQGSDAEGKRINATIGMAIEDDGLPFRLESISRHVELPVEDIFPYAPSAGLEELRKVWKSMLFEKNPSLKNKKISRPIICNGLTHALNVCGFLFADQDDEIILPDLYWGNYNLVFGNSYNARFAVFKMFDGENLNLSGLEENLNKAGKKKILIFNFPNNPTGYTPAYEEIEKIKTILKKAAGKGKKIVVFCDDAYFGLVFEEGIYKESVFSILADLDENILAIKVDGATKEDYAWGFRVGFITYGCKNGSEKLYHALEEKSSGAVRALISNVSKLSQSLLLKAYSSSEYQREKQEKIDLIYSRYKVIKKTIDANPRYRKYFEPLPFNSGYFMCFRLRYSEAEPIRLTLLEKYSTGVIAMGDLIRIAYSAVRALDLPELVYNLFEACRLNAADATTGLGGTEGNS